MPYKVNIFIFRPQFIILGFFSIDTEININEQVWQMYAFSDIMILMEKASRDRRSFKNISCRNKCPGGPYN